MLDDVLAIPDHLRDALWRIESARLQAADSAGVLVCGMGGSAIGGDLAAAAIGDRLTRPMLTIRGYGLPSWTTPDWTVLCSSYSGRTEEALACFAAAEAAGCRRVVASTGGDLVEAARAAEVPVIGLPGILVAPRTAVAYMLAIAAEVAGLAGISPRLHTEIDVAAAFLEEERDRLRAAADSIANRLADRVPVIYGAGLTVPVAHRWKTQVNENAKQHAFAGELPEADHNEICGWEAPGGNHAAVFLLDRDQHPRERRRVELTAATVSRAGAEVETVETRGETRVERLLWGVMLGDLVSLGMAEARGVDPLAIDAIDRLKDDLGDPG